MTRTPTHAELKGRLMDFRESVLKLEVGILNHIEGYVQGKEVKVALMKVNSEYEAGETSLRMLLRTERESLDLIDFRTTVYGIEAAIIGAVADFEVKSGLNVTIEGIQTEQELRESRMFDSSEPCVIAVRMTVHSMFPIPFAESVESKPEVKSDPLRGESKIFGGLFNDRYKNNSGE